jgi:hypothetical protein
MVANFLNSMLPALAVSLVIGCGSSTGLDTAGGSGGTTQGSGGATGVAGNTGSAGNAPAHDSTDAGAGNRCTTSQNTCATDDDCTVSAYPAPIASAGDCSCLQCGFSMAKAIAADCQNAYDLFCGPNWQSVHNCPWLGCPISVVPTPRCVASACQ